ncbi:glycosyl hydrolase family 95 catalytic domain-containing protein [Actinokineospora sp. HUAS TT18]|uniref:glycosyl hydrolase family 95 catalytic domain-containing protein n=1 Tax=Actinokineospora sp. HUAS TT18 TaxID=3447451 RepID=UPI003F5289C5
MTDRAGFSRRSFLGTALAMSGGVLVGGGAIAGLSASAAAGAVIDDRLAAGTGWRDFLGSLDLVWQSVPTGFYQGPFLGNGGLGASIYQRSGTNRLAFVLGDSRVRDHQAGDALWGRARLPIGYLTLQTTGTVTGVDLRLSLFNAELSGFVTTTSGVLSVRAFVHATKDLLVVSTAQVSGTEAAAWTFTPLAAVSPRQQFMPAQRPAGLLDNPAAVVTTTATGGACVQDLACGGRTETRWNQRTEADGTKTLLCSVGHSAFDHTASTTVAATMATTSTLAQLGTEHRAWWNAFYPKSFVSIPDTKLMGFYWAQLYKLGSATRADRPVMATTGPWLEPTPWPGVWWNLNVQLEYWAINPTGHTELDSLTRSIATREAALIANTPAAYRSDSIVIARSSQEDLNSGVSSAPGTTSPVCEAGNLTWALHNVWLAYRHTMDDNLLRDTIFPRLRKAINFYLHFLTKDAAGVYHLPTTYSPEYANASDCNYDLALIHWGCRTLLASADRLGISDPLAAKWQDVLDNLVAPPQDPVQGLMIGKDVKLSSSHRHFSHLLWFYPLYELDVNVQANRDLLTKSLAHWQSMTSALQGYSFTGSSSMYAMLGNGNSALTQLNKLITFSGLKQNTMYAESGPVIETPLAGAQCVHDMLVQSWGDTIRVFPAVPSAWGDVKVHNLLTEGAFQISASRKAGVTEFIRVRSVKGEPCRIMPGGLTGPYSVEPVGSTPGPIAWTTNADGSLNLTLAAGQEAVITKSGTAPALVIAPVATPTVASWGLVPASAGKPVAIASLLNNDGITWQSALTDGNFDNQGYTLPAEEMPTPGLFVSGGVNWTMPSYAGGQKNNLVPGGQTIAVPAGTYTQLHVLGVATSGSATGTVTFTYADGSTTTATLNLSDWGQAPQFGEKVAIQCTHRHNAAGDHALRVKVLHQTIAITGTGQLTSVKLPSHGRMHVFGLTVR